ncbi:apoptosis facilitator Bcl-2-like protein 14 [Hemicordylus capensis]|uniref:apoptosis facilitator Bcl-2-like protein 14 n=1 Tax=Hemicordylus capensis TaxID=884348 RepID=UPI0023022100|nr:apoptosis facilitator Bcl-2-like protein 14 [Hemicordylus capensis]
MNLSGSASMEEISLEDVDSNSMEYKLFVAYAKCRLSPSKFGQFLEREKKGQEESFEREEMQSPAGKGKANQGLSPEDQKHSLRNKSRKKKKIHWKRLMFPSCLRGQAEEWSRRKADAVNEHALKSSAGVGSTYIFSGEEQDDSSLALLVDRLAGIVDHSRASPGGTKSKGLVCADILEDDGGWPSKSISEDDGGKDEEQKIIDTIVALLRKSGDDLEEKMQTDKTFSQSVSDLMSYVFFRKLANQFLKEAPLDPTVDSEVQVQTTKVAFAMEVITRLTAVDTHPMNIVLGFGMKYLRENFNPWIHSRGGWEKALGLSDHEDVE